MKKLLIIVNANSRIGHIRSILRQFKLNTHKQLPDMYTASYCRLLIFLLLLANYTTNTIIIIKNLLTLIVISQWN